MNNSGSDSQSSLRTSPIFAVLILVLFSCAFFAGCGSSNTCVGAVNNCSQTTVNPNVQATVQAEVQATLTATARQNHLSNSTPLPTSPPSTSTPTLDTTPGHILYQEDGSDGWSGWSINSDWALNGKELIGYGNNTPVNYAPFSPGDNNISNYIIEAKITVIRYNGGYKLGFGIISRGTTSGGGYTLSLCGAAGFQECNGDSYHGFDALLLSGQNFVDGNTLQGIPFEPQHDVLHTYSIKIQRDVIKVYIDGGLVIGPVIDATYLNGGQVGIWDEGSQISISSFKVIAA